MMHLNTAGAFFDQMPGGLTNVQLTYWYTAGEGDELGKEMVEPFGGTWLNNWLAAPEDFAYTSFPLETVDDVTKLKMRSAGLGAEVLTEMGASIVFLPGGELYESMQRGVINAFEYGSADNAWDMGFQEVMDYCYISLTRAPSDGGIIVARTEAFEALPDDLKAIVRYVSETVRGVYYESSIVKVAEAMEKIKDYGVQVQPLPKEIEDAFLETAEAYMDEKMAKESPFFRKVVESQRAFKKLCEGQGIY
jgi:TRAP-type mannitol/chloroaromatic compound transport system substrate-binding protein